MDVNMNNILMIMSLVGIKVQTIYVYEFINA